MVDKAQKKRERRFRAHRRVRRSVAGSQERPRLAVYKSLRYIYAQVIDDVQGVTLAQANSREAGIQKSGKNLDAARLVGVAVAERAMEKGVQQVVFDRGGYLYHGRVQKLAEGARAKGLQF
ncbi:MAG: 50S ribosomal protein L18 [Acidimicrobiia bacterium]|nr:50S ribosomal protein L18 [Acidimicrobiia bacterium]